MARAFKEKNRVLKERQPGLNWASQNQHPSTLAPDRGGPIVLACRYSHLDDSRLVPSHPYLYLDPSTSGREAFL